MCIYRSGHFCAKSSRNYFNSNEIVCIHICTSTKAEQKGIEGGETLGRKMFNVRVNAV